MAWLTTWMLLSHKYILLMLHLQVWELYHQFGAHHASMHFWLHSLQSPMLLVKTFFSQYLGHSHLCGLLLVCSANVPKYLYLPSLIKVTSERFQFNHKHNLLSMQTLYDHLYEEAVCSLDTHAIYQLAMPEEASCEWNCLSLLCTCLNHHQHWRKSTLKPLSFYLFCLHLFIYSEAIYFKG